MIPLRDIVPSRTVPFMTMAIIALNTGVWLFQVSLPAPDLRPFVETWALVPASIDPVALVTSMFLHGSWMHFLGNMLFLWIFGDNVEDRVGHGRFVVFYLGCGAAAALAQVASDPLSTVPMVGASGAIAGVMGAYVVLFPRSRVLTLVPLIFFWQIVEVPAVVFLGLWFLLQILMGLGAAGEGGAAGGIAVWAHVAGFVAGLIGIPFFRRPERQRVEWWDRISR